MAARTFRVLLFGLAALLVLSHSAGQAQVTQGSTVIMGTAVVQVLTLDTNTVDFGTLGATEYGQGFAELTPAQNVTIKSNVPWVLNVKADAGTWSYSPPAGMTTADPLKPAGDLQWKGTSTDTHVTSITTTYTSMATTDAQVASGNRGGNIGLQTHFKVLLDYELDPAGDYTLAITYTLTTQ
jgi:hypothetical protein